MPSVVVGRDAELGALRDFVTSISDGAMALVLEGEAGMGKTTLWRAGVEVAEAEGATVLRAQPAESELALSFSGLGDLLDPVLEEALEPLPAGHRSALARALLLEEMEGPPPDAHGAGIALLNALRALASTRPVLVAVDDVQWLDEATAGALAYATRRLKTERVGTLLARRAGLVSPVVDDLRGAERSRELDVGPLGPTALHEVVRAHLSVSLPRPLLAEVHQASGGNPFYALEIVRTLTRSGVSVAAGRPLPVPDSLQELVHGRLLALPPKSREFLVAAAAHAHPTITITETASGIGRDDGLAPAYDARVVETDGERIRFTHPLLAAVALETADPARRREIHSRLAELLEDPEAKAWQLAASVRDPDEAVAVVLENAAEHARQRGAPRPAALLLDCAEQLTPSARPDEALRRAVDAAYLHFEAGDTNRAEARLREIIAPLPSGELRAKALAALARVRLYASPREAADLFARALDETGDDRELEAVANEGVASSLVWLMERLGDAVRHADITSRLAERLGDDALAADAAIARLWAQGALGRADASETADIALRLQEAASDRRLLDQPLVALAEYWMWTDAYGRSREAIHEMLETADHLGDEASRPYLLFLLGLTQSLTGELDPALESARAGVDAATQAGQALLAGFNHALEALVLAQLGSGDPLAVAERALELAPQNGYAELVAAAATGHRALSQGDAALAVSRLAASVEAVRGESIDEPGIARFVVDHVEALVELDRRDEAIDLLAWYDGNAQRLGRMSALANCARCRGLLAAQEGAVDEALRSYERALEWHAEVELPLDRARTLLALGAAQRRTKRRREARATLQEALGVFESIGAELWAARARAELTRISGRAARPGALTPAEQRVAALVAEGKTNREVAAALFLSDRTVEGHLSHVFAKLGVKHRAEVGPALAIRQTQGVDSPDTGDSPVSAGSVSP